MDASTTITISDPDAFRTMLSADSGIRVLFTESGRFRARSTKVMMTDLSLVSHEENLPRIAFIQAPPELMLVGISIAHTDPPTWAGIGVDKGQLIALAPGQCVHMRSESACHWGAIWISIRALSRYASALTGSAFEAPQGIRHLQPPPHAGRRIRSLFLAAIHAAQTSSKVATGPEAAHGLEQQLIYLLVECLAAGAVGQAATPAPRRLDVMRRFEELISARPENAIRVTDAGAAVGVSGRVLRQCCAESLRMSPAAYVRLHQMQWVNHALRKRSPEAARVDEIARRFGFRHPAHFARAYAKLYGETPFETWQQGARRGVPDIALPPDRASFPRQDCG